MDWQRVSVALDNAGVGAPEQLQGTAVVIANFEPPRGPESQKYLQLLIGDVVVIEKKCGDWYFGRMLDNFSKCGAFPDNYLKFKSARKINSRQIRGSVDNGGLQNTSQQRCSGLNDSTSAAVSYDSPMVQEISAVLRAWIKCCRAAYVGRKIDEVLPVVSMVQDVTKWRKQILSGKLPVDEVKKLKQKIGRKIDVGNKKLGLDLVVRDAQGDLVTPDKCSVMELFIHHVQANERIEHDTRTTIPLKSIRPALAHQTSISMGQLGHRSSQAPGGAFQVNQQPTTRSLYINILDFYCRASGDAELSLALYDDKEKQFLSEFFTMVWPQFAESADDGARRTSVGSGGHGQKVLFTDLGGKDLVRDRLYLVCRVVRTGSFENSKEHASGHGHFHDSASGGGSGSGTIGMTGRRTQVRQLYAVGAMELRDVLQTTAVTSLTSGQHGHENDQERQWFFPFIQCSDDNMDQVLKRVIETRVPPTLPMGASPNASGRAFTMPEIMGSNANLSNSHVATKDQGVWVGVQVMIGSQEEVKTIYAHLFTSPPAVVRKMGFPEVISSGDVRNDLYITLVGGDFSHCGRSDKKNIETKVCMVDETGAVLQDAVILVAPKPKTAPYYTSAVYYHEDKPKWGETFKMAIPMEKYSTSHVRFTFKHRSSNESKDKTERPFALAFIRLMQSNETIIGNGSHELVVYKLEKKYEEQIDAVCHSLPSTRYELDQWMQSNGATSKNGPSAPGLTWSSKDSFQIRTVVCSTSLTQNVDLLGLLNWQSKRAELKQSLESLMKSEVDRTGEEVVKFLHNVLDALFEILTESNDYDQQVFDCLVYVIGLVNEHRYSSFKPILDEYLRLHFCSALAYQKLITSFKYYMQNVEDRYERLLCALKSMEYLMKFIVTSRQLRVQLSGSADDFVPLMRDLLKAISDLMRLRTDHSIVCQGAGLRFLPFCVSDIAHAYDSRELAVFIETTLHNVPDDRLQKEKLWCIQNLIKSELYKRCECRRVLQPRFLRIVCAHIENDNELDVCAHILSDLMVVLYGAEPSCHPQPKDLLDIVRFALRPVVQAIVRLVEVQSSRGNAGAVPASRLPSFVALLLSILSELNAELYDDYVNSFATRTDRIDFLTEILMLFNDMIEKTVFSSDWFQMICKRNMVMLKILRFITCTIKKHFLHDFESEVWTICFRTLVAFITQKHLQLEQFQPEKRNEVLCRYGDMREICASELASLWCSMNFAEKRPFIPAMVGPLLEVTLLSQQRVQEKTIPLFFDMMIVGLYPMKKAQGSTQNHGHADSETVFVRFERELISQLDALVEQGRGDRSYVESFERIMEAKQSTHASELNKMGKRLTATVKQLMTKLLEFRDVGQRHNCLDNRMSCTRKLLEFYGSIDHTALYIQYVHKLYELHIDCDNYAEAGFTLKLHADKLRWSDDPVRPSLLPQSYGACTTERTLKEKLYYEILALFDKGQLWERAIQICQELQKDYEESTFDYVKLSGLMEKMSKLYRNIMPSGPAAPEHTRFAYEYFRVGFYGSGFPSFLQNQVFVFRAQPCDRLPEFTARMKSQYPEAEILGTSPIPPPEELQAGEQFLQINSVSPLCDDELLRRRFKGRKMDGRISWYYKNNEVQKFAYSRQISPPQLSSVERKSGIQENQFSTMWMERTVIVISDSFPGVMRWFPVMSQDTRLVSPLEVAIESMQDITKQLTEVVVAAEQSNGRELKPLEARLAGMIKPDVMGGISNYETTFFTEEYQAQCGLEELAYIAQLKDLIAMQIPLLEKGVHLHARYCPDDLVQFHQMVLDSFHIYKKAVEEKYGSKPSLLPPNAIMTPTRLSQSQQKQLSKHMSVDNSAFSSASDLTFRRQGTKDWPTGHSAWGLRHGISTISSGMTTVPRRNPAASSTFKRKASQQSESFTRDTIRERNSNSSLGSTSALSVELLGMESSPTTAIGTSTPIGSAAFSNGIFTLTEHVTPQRPPRPPSSTAASVGMRSETRSESVHSLLANSHETTPPLSDNGHDGMRSYDRVPTPLKFHARSFDSLQDDDVSPEPAPQLPPRRPSVGPFASRQPTLSNAGISRQTSAAGARINRAGDDIREEDEIELPSGVVSGHSPVALDAGSSSHAGRVSQHPFVIPRRPKPLPPKPIENDHSSAL